MLCSVSIPPVTCTLPSARRTTMCRWRWFSKPIVSLNEPTIAARASENLRSDEKESQREPIRGNSSVGRLFLPRIAFAKNYIDLLWFGGMPLNFDDQAIHRSHPPRGRFSQPTDSSPSAKWRPVKAHRIRRGPLSGLFFIDPSLSHWEVVLF